MGIFSREITKKKINNNIRVTQKELVGKNYEYYEPLFKEFERNKKSWNFSALLVAPYWYVYRKMIFFGAFIIGVQVILATLAYFLRSPFWIGMYLLSFVVFYLRAALYGNYDYYKRILSLEKEANNIDDKFKSKYIKDKSGVDVYMTVCWIVGSILIYALALFL